MKLIEYGVYLGIIIIVLFTGCAGPLPKDKEARSLFMANKATFQNIIKMLEEDGAIDRTASNSSDIYIIDPSSTNITVNLNVSNSRKEEYKRIFAMINTRHAAFVDKGKGRVNFIMELSGLVISGRAYKGIAFIPNPADYPPYTIVSSLDRKAAKDLDGKFLVPIEGNWYIYYDCTK